MTKHAETDFFLSPELVSRSFNRAARGYNQHAHIQKTVLSRLFERLDLIRLDCTRMLDLGSGTGAAQEGLQRKFNKAQLVALDLAFNMLKKRRHKRFFLQRRKQLSVCANAYQLPFTNACFDLVFSNLMLQWCSDLAPVLAGIKSVLRPGGLVVFSLFGLGTLRELQQSWRAVDDHIHVNAFYDIHDVGTLLTQAGLVDAVLDTDTLTTYYPDSLGLMNDLRGLGAHNVAFGRRRALTGKKRLLGMIAAYEEQRNQHGLPASYQVIYGHAWNSATPPRDRRDSVPLTELVRGLKKMRR